MKLIQLKDVSILEQLKIEEALLRADSGNWCLLNTGSTPAIVMGISGKPEKLLNLQRVREDQIPLIKRFSGGGTVYVDQDTLFVTFICNADRFSFPKQPKAILEWSEALYKPLFPGFSLRENDYVFGEKKFGGNAQYIQKSRWLHHTSFLWDYQPKGMEYLLLPEKRPAYRQDRSHKEFLCTLSTLYPNKQSLMDKISEHLQTTLEAEITSLESVQHILSNPHRTSIVDSV